jgi:hypothetical protein
MADEELVKHCMCGCMYLEAECPNCNKVTDADHIKTLTAKLAKAVEALHTISGHVVLNNENQEELSESALLARATLAEIEGEKT